MVTHVLSCYIVITPIPWEVILCKFYETTIGDFFSFLFLDSHQSFSSRKILSKGNAMGKKVNILFQISCFDMKFAKF